MFGCGCDGGCDSIVPCVFKMQPPRREDQRGHRGEWTHEGLEWGHKDRKGERTILGV
jgi:hypothetical protein